MKRRHVMDLEETTKDRGMRQILAVTMQKPVLITINFNQHSTKTLFFPAILQNLNSNIQDFYIHAK